MLYSWCYIPHNSPAGQQFVFWNNNEPEHTLLSVVRLLVQYSKCPNRLMALRCYAHFIWALSVMIALKISVFCAKAEVERIHFASTFVYVMAKISIQVCDVAYFLPVQSHCKFGSKWLLSCTFSKGGVTSYLFVSSHRGTWLVFKKVSLVSYIFNSSNDWIFCSGRKFLQFERGFLYFQNKILLLMFFHFWKKSYIQYM